MTFRWVDPSTKRAFKAKQSRSKGNSWELEVANMLKGVGYEGIVSSRSESKRMDDAKIDLVDKNNELPVYVQCKCLATTPNYYAIESACPLKDKPFVIAWKKAYNDGTPSPEPLAMIPLNYLIQLLAK